MREFWKSFKKFVIYTYYVHTDPYGSIVCREIFAQCDEALDKTIKNCKFLKGFYDVL